MPEATRRRPESAPVRAVSRTMLALELLADASGMTVLQLAEALEVEKSIASRLLSSLLSQGYLVRDPDTDRYELSLKLLALASRYADRVGFPATCQPVLQSLSAETRELVQLSAVEQGALVLVAQSRSRHVLALQPPRLGTSLPLHATASGKAWLASLNDEQATETALRAGLRELTPRTITTVQRLLAELEKIRRLGYATAEGEFIEGVNAIAIGVGSQRFGATVGIIALSAPSGRLDDDRIGELVPLVEAAARELEPLWPIDAVRLAAVAGSAAGSDMRHVVG